MTGSTAGRRVVAAASWLASAGAVHAAINARLLRRCPTDPPPVTARVAILVPARDEAATIERCLRAVSGQRRLDDWVIGVLDDGSVDDTAGLVRTLAATEPRITLHTGNEPPRGWLGKPHACARLAAAHPEAEWLVFVDADVVLAPDAVAAAVTAAERFGVDLLCPFPRQLAHGPAERLVQPLLAWSWLTLVPLRLAEGSTRPSLAVATGQFLVVRRSAYDRAGTHAAVRGDVLEDLGLARAIRRAGGRTAVVDGTALAQCRMYDGWAQVRDGYGKSLWAAFGSPGRAAVVVGAALLLYVVPPAAALRGSRAGRLGYLAAVGGRLVAARRTGSTAWPDPFAHPVSMLAAGWLVLRSVWQRRQGSLRWKGRPV